MKIYQVRTCPFAHRARIALEEKGLKYEIVYFGRGERPEELERVSPDARSPTLHDETADAWVWDSLVVCEYLDECYPQAPLMPKDAAGRARARLWMREVDSKVLPPMGPIVQELVHKTEGAPDMAKVQTALDRRNESLAVWNARLAGQPFLLGESLSLVDITLYTPLFSLLGIVGPSSAVPANLPELQAWCERVAARPSTAY